MKITTVIFDQIRHDNFAKLRREIIKDNPTSLISNTYCNLLLRGIFIFWDEKDVPKHWDKQKFETFDSEDRNKTIKRFETPDDEFTAERIKELEKELKEAKEKLKEAKEEPKSEVE